MSDTDFPKAVLTALAARSSGICEGCGDATAENAHHRQYRGRGGSNLLSNALHLCGWGNATGCHAIAHTAIGDQLGWSIRSGFDPAVVPRFRKSDGTWWRTPEGAAPELLAAEEAVAYLVGINAIKSGLGA